jgi:DNA-binding NarL/FixJ family response regulator
MLVSSQADMEFAGEADNGRAACDLAAGMQLDLMLMDIRMPEMDGIEATERILARAESDSVTAPKIIALTTFDHDEAAVRAIRAGASGFLTKHAEPEFLLATLRAVHAGNAVIAANATHQLLARLHDSGGGASPSGSNAQLAALTERERAIFKLAARGLSNAEIAAREVRSEATIKSQISRILTKLELRDRVQLVVFAFDHGLTD